MALGGNIEAEGPIALMRFANRVPLLYQQAACATTRSAIGLDWRNYRLSQSSGSLPTGPLVVLIHLASVWVPFTSESKEAIAHYPEIMREIRLALQECGRQIGDHINRQRKAADAARKKSYIEQYIDHIADALQEITGDTQAQKEQLAQNLQGMLERSRS